ncbi:hypothetical protein [Hymenobacter cheonanensis]|uniref:hypothetical protein n=1 Tax=Hymenobacter sp. CA2-7 TaxID=3063993 RepID=UPI0027124945|nr:hypothetical protein [Hymenobacter sp. CA2-7]MDO7888217.1 hypothetical protein [Hymenobacter sp. CA2-7]
MKQALTLGIIAVCLFFGVRACLLRDELRTHGHLVPAKVLTIGGIRGGIAVTYTYAVAGKTYTRTSALGGRYTIEGDSIYLKYLPQDPAGNVRLYLSRAEITASD